MKGLSLIIVLSLFLRSDVAVPQEGSSTGADGWNQRGPAVEAGQGTVWSKARMAAAASANKRSRKMGPTETPRSTLEGYPGAIAKQDTAAPKVTPASGPSWIKRLGLRSTRSTAMGRMGGNMPPPRTQRKEPSGLVGEDRYPGRLGRIMDQIFSFFRGDRRHLSELLDQTFVLTGADLYRLNCQSCHGPDGAGAPPEIKSLLDPIRGASPTLLKERMEKLGRSIDDEMARELAAGAEATLRQRLEEGGEKMPDFKHLRGDEVDALLEYLKELAGVPESERKEIAVTQSVARVGEHLVKGTCQICHDATGPGGGHMAMMRGIIPSLASFPRELSIQQVVRQVRMGSSPMMSMMGGDTMPAFPYLTEAEVAAAYLYLVEYPPRP